MTVIRRRIVPFILVFLLPFYMTSVSAGQGKTLEPLPTGEAFSSDHQKRSMPEDWLGKPIAYASDVGAPDLFVNLDQSNRPYLAPLIEDFARTRGVEITVGSGTCGISNRLVFHRQVDVASFCCPLGSEDRFPGTDVYTIGISPLALVINPDNPIDDVSFAEAQALFTGDVQRWSQLAAYKPELGFDQPVQPVAFVHCKKRPGHWRLLLENDEYFSPRLKSVKAIPDMIRTVGRNSRAVGYDGVWLAEHYGAQTGKLKMLKINGFSPADLDNVLHGRYPLYRTYNLVVWSREAGGKALGRELVDHLMSYVERHGERFSVVSADRLRAAGWRFENRELVGTQSSL